MRASSPGWSCRTTVRFRGMQHHLLALSHGAISSTASAKRSPPPGPGAGGAARAPRRTVARQPLPRQCLDHELDAGAGLDDPPRDLGLVAAERHGGDRAGRGRRARAAADEQAADPAPQLVDVLVAVEWSSIAMAAMAGRTARRRGRRRARRRAAARRCAGGRRCPRACSACRPGRAGTGGPAAGEVWTRMRSHGQDSGRGWRDRRR